MTTDSFEDRVVRKRQTIEEQLSRQPFRVAILGPGESNEGFDKRSRIKQELVTAGFEAFFPEAFLSQHSPIPGTEQERQLLRDHDVKLIIVLNASAGPLAELSTYYDDLAITQKSLVLVPFESYSPGSYPWQVLSFYLGTFRYTRQEFQECRLIPECLSKAKARRWQDFGQLEYRQF